MLKQREAGRSYLPASRCRIASAHKTSGPAGEDKRFLDVKLSDLTKEQIEKYYKDKSKSGRKDQKSGDFTCGCCCQFAKILHLRFPVSEIVYGPAANYFAAKIDGRIYDITGDVTEQGKRELWSEYELGFSFRDGVVKECIMFCRFWKSSQQHPRKSAADTTN